jgi:hypothetical protein
MAGHSDSESDNSYSDDVEFKEKESEILLGLSNGGCMVVARAPLCVLFVVARKCHHRVFVSCCSMQMGTLVEARGSLGQSIVLWPSIS